MGSDLFDSVPDVFDAASQAAGLDIRNLLASGSEQQLRRTEITQVAITAVNAAVLYTLRQYVDLEDSLYAGFSLGEITAYHAAGILNLEQLFSIASARGRIMSKAAETAEQKVGSLGMAAVIGLDFSTAVSLLQEYGGDHLYAANDNSPVQVVLSGLESSIEKITPILKEHGAKRVIPLKVSAPFHTPLLEQARREFSLDLDAFEFSDPKSPVYSTVTGEVIKRGSDARKLCVQQLTAPVRWTRIMQNIAHRSVLSAIEAGPGKTLTGFWNKTVPGITCLRAGTLEEIKTIGDRENE
jgi:[acyl-carrier-protein] S-malonyltransferase